MVGALIERIKHADRSGFVDGDSAGDSAAFPDQKGINRLESEAFSKLIADSVQGVFSFCDLMRKGRIEVSPREGFANCGYGVCDFYDLCRVDL